MKKTPRSYIKAIAPVALMTAFAAAFAAAFGLTALLYRYTGAPPELWRNIITGVVGVLLLSGCFALYRRTLGRKHIENHEHAIDGALEALRQIARGNFDAAMDLRLDNRLIDLADTINDMAKSLGTLETMRQDFVSNVSHEIQSPLTSISGFAELLQNGDLSAADRARYAKVIETESKRLSSLSDNLLKLSTLDNNKSTLNKHEFRLDKQIESAVLALEPQWMGKNLTMEADMQRCAISGDEDLLSRVWMNLLHNAIKFTPVGGRISISLTAGGGSAMVKISDTGIGIATDDQIHIFERFYKVDKSRDRSLGGNGLGLSLVKRIVELHGGSVAVDSETGKGASFVVELR